MIDECRTDFGKFKIKLEENNINVGGRNFCVNIILYEKEITLYWLKTDEGGCELNEKEIKGINTVNMTDLGFSLIKKYYPHREQIVTLLDDSGFSWKDSKGKKYKTNFLKGYLLLHGKTWYEEKFNAVMCDSEIYLKYREKADNNFNDPSKKPTTFNFMNNSIQEKLEPLYNNSKTWNEFINKLIEKYDNDKYKMIYDWYRTAIYIIFDGMEINQNWKIDISKRPIIDCKPSHKNGGSKTKKNKRIIFSNYYRIEPFSWNP